MGFSYHLFHIPMVCKQMKQVPPYWARFRLKRASYAGVRFVLSDGIARELMLRYGMRHMALIMARDLLITMNLPSPLPLSVFLSRTSALLVRKGPISECFEN